MDSPTSTQSSLLDTPPPSVSPSPSSPEPPAEETGSLSLASSSEHPPPSTSRPKVYPSADSGANKQPQTFSRSARKRNSVQALGSIEVSTKRREEGEGVSSHTPMERLTSRTSPLFSLCFTLAAPELSSFSITSPSMSSEARSAESRREGEIPLIEKCASSPFPPPSSLSLLPSLTPPSTHWALTPPRVGIASSSEAVKPSHPSKLQTSSPPASHFLSTSFFPHLTLQDLPPSPARPNGHHAVPMFPPRSEIRTDPELLRPGVIRDLKAVERVFELGGDDEREVDVLELLKTTIGAIRLVRNLVVALPDDAFPPNPLPTSPASSPSPSTLGPPSPPTPHQAASSSLRPHQTFSTPSRPSHLSRPTQPRVSSSSGIPSSSSIVSSPVTQIRKAALDVLGSLRLVEEQYRLPDEEPALSPSRSRTSSEAFHPTSPNKPSFAHRLSPLKENSTLPPTSPFSSSASDASFNLGWGSLGSADDQKRASWEDRFGMSYLNGVAFGSSEALRRERKVVERYLSLVDEVLFGGGEGEVGKRGWDREMKKRRGGRKSSLGPVEVLQAGGQLQTGEEDDDGWLDEGKGTPLRLHSLLTQLLPPHLAHHLPPLNTLPGVKDASATSLETYTNGQLLCQATNFAIRRSRRPWGFVPEHEIHDVLGDWDDAPSSRGKSGEGLAGEGATAKKEYVFRKVENLRVWAAAIKLRYLVPVVPPPSPISTVPLPPQAIIFDPSIVAKREPGWEDMLDSLIKCWIDKLVEEEREERARDEEDAAA